MPSIEVKRICAWCCKDLDIGHQLTDAEYEALENIATHGICPECTAKQFPIPSPDGHKIPEKSIESHAGLSGGGISNKQTKEG